MASRFGSMLQDRRRQMGLSIQQVANIVKIRPQIIEFFEMGDFASMPPRGYAQGMISSYARFLGLNPREVVNSYFDELRAYEEETAHSGGRYQDAAGYVSPRSSSATGRFMMVGPASGSRYAQRPPQAGYVPEVQSGHEPQPPRTRRPVGRGGAGETAQLRPVTTGRMPAGGPSSFDRGRVAPRAAGTYRGGTATQRDASYPRGGASRRNGAPMRSGQPPRRPSQGRPRGARGSASPVQTPVLIGIGVLLLAILVLLVVLLFRGCTPSTSVDDNAVMTIGSDDSSSSRTDTLSPSDSDSDSDEDEDGGTAADDESSTADQNDPDAADSEEKPQETKVKISVADGDSSWVEIRLDGSVVFGNEVYGPWEQEYTVTDSIRITANEPGSVSVTMNGEDVRWDTSTSGVARINITAPEPEPASDDSAEGAEGSDTGADNQDQAAA